MLIKNLKIANEDILSLVASLKYKDYKIVGDPVSQAKIYESQLADELLILFIDNHLPLNSKKNKELINTLSSKTFMPLTIGGGIRNMSDIKFLMNNGADKISINTFAFKNSMLIKKASKIYGSQCIVVSVDYFFDKKKKKFFIKIQDKFLEIEIFEYLKKFEKMGAGEILLTNINLDGSGRGMDIDNLKEFRKKIKIPIIASGGCGVASHFSRCFIDTNVDAISAGNFFCFKDQNPMQTRSHIKNSGIEIRI